jgi:hypothetical protein
MLEDPRHKRRGHLSLLMKETLNWMRVSSWNLVRVSRWSHAGRQWLGDRKEGRARGQGTLFICQGEVPSTEVWMMPQVGTIIHHDMHGSKPDEAEQ